MGSQLKKKLKRANYYLGRLHYVIESKKGPCINCGKPGAHFVPPSFGEEGFYTCGPKETPNVL